VALRFEEVQERLPYLCAGHNDEGNLTTKNAKDFAVQSAEATRAAVLTL